MRSFQHDYPNSQKMEGNVVKGRRFESIKPGDQVEMPARKIPAWYRDDDTRDPERTARVAVVTHRWHDPVEGKDYVALAMIIKGGAITGPKEKRTIVGLAQAGWRPASQDWIAYAKALDAGEIVQLRRKPSAPKVGP